MAGHEDRAAGAAPRAATRVVVAPVLGAPSRSASARTARTTGRFGAGGQPFELSLWGGLARLQPGAIPGGVGRRRRDDQRLLLKLSQVLDPLLLVEAVLLALPDRVGHFVERRDARLAAVDHLYQVEAAPGLDRLGDGALGELPDRRLEARVEVAGRHPAKLDRIARDSLARVLGHGVGVAFAVTRVRPLLLSSREPVGRALGVKGATAVLELEEIMHLASGEAVQHSSDTFAPGGIDLQVRRNLEVAAPAPLVRTAWRT